jgi:hypothetical protein
MIDPSLWNNVPFKNPTAWRDFVGTHWLYWQQGLAPAIFDLTGLTVRLYPIGDGGGGQWLQAVQAQYVAGAAALGAEPPPDLSSYDLSNAEDFASWTFLLAQSAQRLRIAAGLT